MESQRRVGLPDIHHGRARRRSPLLAPLRYLWIEAATKTRYDFILPTIVGLCLWGSYNLAGSRITVFGADGFLIDLQGLLQMAVPFLIGALATVAMASPGEAIDRRLTGAPVTLDGAMLTTRQFVCYLLGYLSFLGFSLLIFIITIKAFREPVSWIVLGTRWAEIAVQQLTAGVFSLLLASFCLTTFWALFFLTDVVNRRI
ncbi:hypothetical protein [Aureimonas ureilytica]|uniref:hypothetical protein n=1 Tax=Aureimonas ureilytica TaxID=401562 RepID=UPI000A6F6259|nr:hypothetical protein [Aureimonas ureilytica]